MSNDWPLAYIGWLAHCATRLSTVALAQWVERCAAGFLFRVRVPLVAIFKTNWLRGLRLVLGFRIKVSVTVSGR